MSHLTLRCSFHALFSLLAISAFAACGDDGNGDGTSGTGAGTGGVGFAGVGAGGMAGAAGMAGAGGMTGGAGMAAGMGGMTGGAGAGGTGGGATFAPTFGAIFDEIIVGTGCNGGPLCHGGMVGMLQMIDKQATYTALVGVAAMGTNLTGQPPHCADSGLMRVVAGNPDMSLLMQKIDGTQTCGTAMPPNPPLLSEMQRTQIRMWIQNGAMNN